MSSSKTCRSRPSKVIDPQEPRRDDAVGVDVVPAQRDQPTLDALDADHAAHARSPASAAPAGSILRMSTTSPATAAAATIAGLIRSVRPVGLPCRPLKLRLDDDAQISRPCELVGIHAQAHGAPRPTPVEARLEEDLVQALGFGRGAHALRARHHHRPHGGRDLVAAHEPRRLAQIGQPRVRARPDERDVDGRALDRLPGREAHELQRLLHERPVVGLDVGRRGHALVDADGLPGMQPPGDDRTERGCLQFDVVVVTRVGIAGNRTPPRLRPLEGLALRRERAPLQVGERRLVRVDVSDTGAAFDGHVAHGHALVHRHGVHDGSGVLVRVADAALHAEHLDDLEDHVLGVDAARERALDADAAHLQRLHRQTLGGQHVAHLRRADAERDGAERAVRRGVAVAAGDRHPRLRQPQLWPDDVDDPLPARRVVVERHAEVAAVALECREHGLCHGVLERAGEAPRRDDVVDRGERPVREAHGPAATAQVVERLRGRDFVHEMQSDEQLRLSRRERPHRVQIPDLLEKRVSHRRSITRGALSIATDK